MGFYDNIHVKNMGLKFEIILKSFLCENDLRVVKFKLKKYN